MQTGQTMRVKAVTASEVIVESDGEERYGLGPALRGHEGHRDLKVGDVLVAVNDSGANRDTLVKMECGCTRLLNGVISAS